MKKFILFGLFACSAVYGQSIELQTIFEDKISIRAIEIYDGKVWYAGAESKFGYVTLDGLNKKQIQLSDEKLQFRTLGQDMNSFYTISIESPAKFFKVDKKNLAFNLVKEDLDKNAFYDALHFYKSDEAITFSDPEDDQNLKLQQFKNGKWEKVNSSIKLAKGEAAFAASNSNLTSKGNWIWLVTGGKESNVYKLCKKDFNKIYKYKTPIIQGESAQGAYTIDFYDRKNGIIAGGDYTKPEKNVNNIATTQDGGKTWQIQASGQNAGYTTYVGYAPNSKGRTIVAVGDFHISLSFDRGKTWKKISDEKGFFTAKWVDENNLVLAGKNKIAKLKIVY